MSDKATLIAEVNTNYPDNVTGDISPADLRNASIDEINSWQQAPLINPQTGTTAYTVVLSDYGKVIIFNSASLVTVTFPSAGTAGFFPFNVMIKNEGAGTVVLTPASGTIDGAATKNVVTNQSSLVLSNGVNWRTGINSGAGGVSPSGNNGEINVKDFGAVGDQLTNDTAAIAAAIAATPFGGTLYFPAGSYNVSGSGATLFTVTQPIKIRGDGPGSLIFNAAVGSIPAMGATTDVFTFAPTSTVYGVKVRDININCPGRHALNFEPAAGKVIFEANIDNVQIAPTATGYSIRFGSVGFSTIERCFLDAVWLDQAGDGITIRNSIFSSATRDCIHASFVQGAGGFVVAENVFSGFKGHVVIEFSASSSILYNEFEAPSTDAPFSNPPNTSAGAALVDIGTGPFPPLVTSMTGPQLIGNQYSVLGAANAGVSSVRVRTAVVGTTIDDLRYTGPNNPQIKIDAGATDTRTGARSGGPIYSNAGTRSGWTITAADGSAGLPSIAFLGDLTTGMWRPTSGAIAWSTGGVESMRLFGAQLQLHRQTGALPAASIVPALHLGDYFNTGPNFGVATHIVLYDNGTGPVALYGFGVVGNVLVHKVGGSGEHQFFNGNDLVNPAARIGSRGTASTDPTTGTLVVDGTGGVGVGGNICLGGFEQFAQIAAPSNPAAGLRIYVKDAGGVPHLCGRNSAGTETDYHLVSGGRTILTGSATLNVPANVATIQGAYDFVVSSLDFGGQTVTIQVANGTFASAVMTQGWVGGGQLIIKGNGPTLTTVSGASAACFDISATLPGPLTIQDMALTTTGVGSGVNHTGVGIVNVKNLTLGPFVNSAFAASGPSAFIKCPGTGTPEFTVAGNMQGFWTVQGGGNIDCVGKVIRLTSPSTLVIGTSWAYASNLGYASLGFNQIQDASGHTRQVGTGTINTGNNQMTGVVPNVANLSVGMQICTVASSPPLAANDPSLGTILNLRGTITAINTGANSLTMSTNGWATGAQPANSVSFEHPLPASPSGYKFKVNHNGVIDTAGSGIGYFPGLVNGEILTGGVYV